MNGNSKITLFGTALFDGDTIVGNLTGDKTRFLLMVRDEFERGFFTMQDPNRADLAIPIDVSSLKSPKINVTFIDQKPVIQVKIFLNGEILAVQSRVYYEYPQMKTILEKRFSKSLEKGIQDLADKCINLNVDAMKLGSHAVKKFLTIDEREEYEWNKNFSDTKVEVDVEFYIRRTGTQIYSNEINDSSGDN
ncbi:MAG TPA: hypothetical protein DDZ89_18570 [Clostridiales bacterium]|nr:hypothetical protein [Clostridiales bacterium]